MSKATLRLLHTGMPEEIHVEALINIFLHFLKLHECIYFCSTRYRYVDLGEIKKAAANFLVLVKLKVMDDNVCKLHIGPRAEALAHSQIFFIFCCPLLPQYLY